MHFFSKKITPLLLFATFFFGFSSALAQEGEGAQAFEEAASKQVSEAMEQQKAEAINTLASLKDRIKNIPRNDDRRQEALKAIEGVDKEVQAFQAVSGEIEVIPGVGNTPPVVQPNQEFRVQQEKVEKGFIEINRILLAPAKPASVPEGDLVEGFIPQLVRQLFRFASIAVFVAFVVSGVMFVMAFGNDERVESAKKILYYSIIGFIFVALAFAIVQAITDIDLFRFTSG